ncbi:MAG: oxidoreductase, partial [Candidatus Firestonebacteria bacterium GWA2_43_8]
MPSKLSWGIIGTGNIAGKFAAGLAVSKTGKLVAAGSRDIKKAGEFVQKYGGKAYGSYEELLSDPAVEAVYISTPHPFHAEWAIKAAEAKKHILCEKPIGINHAEAMSIVDAARVNKVFLMEAFMYRCHPQTKKLVELLKNKTIGEVRVIQTAFAFNAGFSPESRLFKNALAGGGILDVGCYCISMSRLIAGTANGKDFIEPLDVKSFGHLTETGVDGWAVGILKFPGDILAEVSTGVQVTQQNVVRIYGSEGSIELTSPWFCNGKILLSKGGKTEEVAYDGSGNLYGIEADTVAEFADKLKAASPAMSPEDTLGNMRACDMWRNGFDFFYDVEKDGAVIPTVDRRPLLARKTNKMKYGKVPGVENNISRIVLGTMLEGQVFHRPAAHVLFDEFFRHGGNCFDTAYVYGGGKADITLGQWIKNRNIRKDAVVIAKGAHTPACNPIDLKAQFLQSLDRMKTSYADIYMLHRDNSDIPAGEFIDVLNELKDKGLVKAFGGSNWCFERIEEANKYAASKGKTGFSVVSNNFSLARLVEPMWGGCISSSDADSK